MTELNEIDQKVLKILANQEETIKLGILNNLVGGSPNSVINARIRLVNMNLVVVVDSHEVPNKGAQICRLTLEGRKVAEHLQEIDKIMTKKTLNITK